MTLQYLSLMPTNTPKQILDCTISQIKEQHPCVNSKEKILQNVLCQRKIYTKQNVKKVTTKRPPLARKNHIKYMASNTPLPLPQKTQ